MATAHRRIAAQRDDTPSHRQMGGGRLHGQKDPAHVHVQHLVQILQSHAGNIGQPENARVDYGDIEGFD